MTIVEVDGLRKVYGDTLAVDEVSFTVERGEIFGILGPNGAGKTTTVECIEGLRRPDAGRISVLGLDPQRDGPALRQRLGVQLQSSRLPEKLEVWEAVDLYASFYDDPADGEELIAQLGLAGKRRTRFGKLSGGQQQRLSIALALVGNPEVAVLDELTTGLDPQARRDTWELIEQVRDRGVTILLVTHFMEEAERLCDRLAIIDRGRVVAVDSPDGLVARVGGEQQLRFVPSAPFEDRLLIDLPEVTSFARVGEQVVVSGGDEVIHAVIATLAREDVVTRQLRVDQTRLDDAFLALTGRRIDDENGDRGDGASAGGSGSDRTIVQEA